jgi:hypothetical protein
MKRLAYFLRWGHWPKRFRYPHGIPRVAVWGRTNDLNSFTGIRTRYHSDGTVTEARISVWDIEPFNNQRRPE